MKNISTIRRQIARLRRLSEDESIRTDARDMAYEAYHALRWVIEDTSWTPVWLIKQMAAEAEREVDAESGALS